MKNKISKILGVVLSVALLSSLAVIAAPVAAAPGVNAFGNVGLPSDDFEGTDVTILAFNADGSIMYAAVEDGGDWAVMKSEDGGFNWEDTTMDFAWYTATGSLGRIVDIVVAPSNDGTVYVGYSSGKVYRMLDEGEGTATVLTTIKNEEGINATTLYDIDVFYDDASGANYVLVGTNIDALVFKDAGLFEEWVPLNLIDYAGADNVPGGSDDYLGYGVLAVAFAPDFASSSIIWAVWDNSTTTGDSTSSPMSAPNYLELASTVGTGVWNTVFESLPFDNTTYADEIPASQYPVDIAFPTDYDSEDPYMYLALTDPAAGSGTADGNIYLCVIDDIGGISEAEGLLAANEDMCSVEVYGDVIIGGTLGVGSGDLGIFLSNNGGDTFDFIDGPTGVTYARVYMMPGEFDPAEGVAYCTTMGLGSALSRSVDGGHTWMQIGLIDTDVDWIGDLAFMTEGDTQEAFLITAYGPTRALWRTADATAANVQWERVLSYAPISGNTDYRPLDVEVSMDGSIVMIYAYDGGGDYSIYKSTNAGEASPQFTHWRTLPDSDVEDINDWVVYDGSTIYCATDGGFYGTSRFGPATTELTTEDLESVDIQPGFDPDDADAMTIAVGNDDGDIFVSTNKGEDWSAAYATGGGDDVQVAFDADFATAGADGEGLLYFATEDSLVGVAELDGNAVTDIDTLYDSWDMTPGVDSYYELIVAPDNAIYVLGEEETTSTTYTYNVDGTVDLVGEPYIQVNGVIQVMNDSSPSDVSDITYQVDVPLTGVVGTFINGEALLVIGDSLFFDDTADTISGDVIVQGVTSGATGVFNSATALNMQDPALSTWTGGADSTVTVTSSSMFIGIPTATYTYTNVALAGTGWTDGETLSVTGSSILGADVEEASDTVSLEGDTSGATDTIEGDDSGVSVSGDTFAASEVVTVAGSNISVDEVGAPGSTSEYTYMFRLLLHQDDNVWEYAYNPYMEEMWYSEGSNIIWAEVDEYSDDTLEAFEDFLSGMVEDVTATEINITPSTSTKTVEVSWSHVMEDGVVEYLISYSDGTTTLTTTKSASGPVGTTLSVEIGGLSPVTAYTFMVRVNDGSPYQSRWSSPASETTGAYILPPVPEVPAQGLQNAPLLPSFVWQAASGAVSYDFQLSTSPSFSSLIVDTNVTATGYTVTSELAYDTNHYWRVRSVAADDTVSAWCSIQNFHTRTEEIPPVTVEPQPTPTVILPTPTVVIPDITVQPPAITVEPPAVTVPITTVQTEVNPVIQMPPDETPVFIWIIVAIGAVLTIAVIVLIIRTRRVV